MKVRARLSSKGNAGWCLALKGRSVYTLGRHPSCSIVLNDMHISSKHLSLSLNNENRSISITDTSSNGTWLNGQKLERNKPVTILFDEPSSHEIILPCEDSEKDDYTFILTVGGSTEDFLEDVNGTKEFKPSELPRFDARNESAKRVDSELIKLQENLILSSCRIAASAYELERPKTQSQNDESSILNCHKAREVVDIAKDTIDALKRTNHNSLKIAHEILLALKAVTNRIVASENIEATEKRQLLADIDVELFSDALAPLLEISQSSIR